jgi:hypothetical protein
MLKQFIGGEWIVVGGGGGGSSDYDDLTDKPQINSHTLSGNKSSSDLGLQDVISDLETIRSGASAGATAVQPAAMESALSGKQDEITDLETIRSGAGAGATAVQTIKINGTAQTKTNGEVDLPAYPTSLPASNTTNSYSSSGTDPISGQGVAAAIGTLDVSAYGGTGKYIKSISETNGKISPVEGTLATQPAASNQEPITSDGVYQDQARQDAIIARLLDTGVKNYVVCTRESLSKNNANYINNGDGTYTVWTSSATSVYYAYRIVGNPDATGYAYGVPLPRGKYILTGLPSGADTSNYRYIFGLMTGPTATRQSLSIYEDYTFEVTNDTTRFDLSIYLPSYASLPSPGKLFQPMLCRQEDYQLSAAFVAGALSNAELTAKLIELVDSGAKNLMPTANGSNPVGETWFRQDIDLPAGNYIVWFDSYTTTDTDEHECRIGFFDANGDNSSSYEYVTVDSNRTATNVAIPVRLTKACTNVRFYPSKTVSASSGDTLTFTGCMICTEQSWRISKKNVPYCPTLQDLYAMIQNQA